jgi:ribosomal-protein-alanine N-acetyltransferase
MSAQRTQSGAFPRVVRWFRGVRLVTAYVRLLDAALVGDDGLADVIGYPVVPGWTTFEGALERTRDAAAADRDSVEWGSRFLVAGDPPELVAVGRVQGAAR